MIVSGGKAQWGEAGAGVGAIAEGLPLAAATGAPEVGPADLQHNGTGAWLSDDGIGHRGSQNASGLKLLGDTMTSHMVLQAVRPRAKVCAHMADIVMGLSGAFPSFRGLNLFPA